MGAFVIKGGEIYDPAAQKWEKKDIAIENGMIISGMPSGEYQVVDASGCKVTTGWIDYHVHYFNHGTENGITRMQRHSLAVLPPQWMAEAPERQIMRCTGKVPWPTVMSGS